VHLLGKVLDSLLLLGYLCALCLLLSNKLLLLEVLLCLGSTQLNKALVDLLALGIQLCVQVLQASLQVHLGSLQVGLDVLDPPKDFRNGRFHGLLGHGLALCRADGTAGQAILTQCGAAGRRLHATVTTSE